MKNISWYIHSMQYYSALNRNELRIHTTMWMSFKNTEQENPDIEKCILCDSRFMLNSRKDYLNLWPQKADQTTNQNSCHFFSTQLMWEACSRKGTSYVLLFLLFLLSLLLGSSDTVAVLYCCFSSQHWPSRVRVEPKDTSLIGFCNVTWPTGNSCIFAKPQYFSVHLAI